MIFKKDENEYMMRLVTESPQMCEVGRKTISDSEIIKIYDNHLPIDEFLGMGVYMTKYPNELGVMEYSFLVINDEKRLEILYKFAPKTTGIEAKTVSTRSSNNIKGAFEKFFVDFLIPKLSTIESDDKLSCYGLKFWKKLITKYKQFLYFVIDNKNLKVMEYVTDPSRLDNYFGPSEAYKKYSFVVSNKNSK